MTPLGGVWVSPHQLIMPAGSWGRFRVLRGLSDGAQASLNSKACGKSSAPPIRDRCRRPRRGLPAARPKTNPLRNGGQQTAASPRGRPRGRVAGRPTDFPGPPCRRLRESPAQGKYGPLFSPDRAEILGLAHRRRGFASERIIGAVVVFGVGGGYARGRKIAARPAKLVDLGGVWWES